MAALLFPKASAQSLEETFRTPPEEAKPLMIWQWMDGMVTREGITADLEAYKAAGIGGVQQFLVGGDMQTLVKDPANAIGTAPAAPRRSSPTSAAAAPCCGAAASSSCAGPPPHRVPASGSGPPAPCRPGRSRAPGTCVSLKGGAHRTGSA